MILDYPGGPHVITKVLIGGRQESWSERSRVTEGDVMMEVEVGVMQGHKPRNSGSL